MNKSINDKIKDNIYMYKYALSDCINYAINKYISDGYIYTNSILPTPCVKNGDISPDILYDSKYDKYIDCYYSIIKKVISKNDMVLFKNNINSLRIINDSSINKKNNYGITTTGEYDIINNKILLLNSSSIYHELLHMSSSIKVNNDYYSGFLQYVNEPFICIGIGLMEGYTALLEERYFPNENSSNIYVIEKGVASCLESIIGQDKMMNYYFNANIKDLVDDLRNYVDYNEIIIFLKELDYIKMHINKNNGFSKKRCEIFFYQIQLFLNECLNKIDSIKRNYYEKLFNEKFEEINPFNKVNKIKK